MSQACEGGGEGPIWLELTNLLQRWGSRWSDLLGRGVLHKIVRLIPGAVWGGGKVRNEGEVLEGWVSFQLAG